MVARGPSSSQPPRSLANVLYLHRSERSDHLVDALGDLLLGPLADPMAREVVAVPTRGVERWLSQRLSHRLGASNGAGDGVCANIDFPFPGGLVADLFDSYAVHRPEMLLAWNEGAEGGPTSSRTADMAWQAELWRHLRHR